MSWIKNNGVFSYIPEVATQSVLEPGVYNIDQDPMTGEIFLVHSKDSFDFPYKIYNKDEVFVNRVVKTFNSLPSNLGILLNGLQGTGKTVTAKLICNALSLPVIVQTKTIKNIEGFLAKIEQDVVFFVDEYEKIYATTNNDDDDKGSTSPSLLSIMDGVLNSNTNKLLFLFTTNSTKINKYLKNRPSRLRYIKQYNSLEIPIIIEIIEDLLQDKAKKNDLVKYLSTLEFLTIDSVKTIIQELNIHSGETKDFKDFYNLSEKEVNYNLVNISDKSETYHYKTLYPDLPLLAEDPEFNIEDHMHSYVSAGNKNLGELVDFNEEEKIITTRRYVKGEGVEFKYSYEKLDYSTLAF